jgi:hypothetical protein
MGWLSWDDFTSTAGDFFSSAGHAIETAYDHVSSDIGGILSGAKDIVIHTEDNITGTYNKVIDTGGGVLNKTLDTADDLGKTLFTSSLPLIVGGAAVAYFVLIKK